MLCLWRCLDVKYFWNKCWHNKTIGSLFSVFTFSCCSWAILHPPLLMLLCYLPLHFLLCLFVFTLPPAYIHPTHTHPIIPLSSTWNTTLLLCSHSAPAALESKQRADTLQSLTRLFSAAAADDPVALFHGKLMWFDIQRGPCRSHNTCFNTLFLSLLSYLSSTCMLNLASQICRLLPSLCVTAPFLAALHFSVLLTFSLAMSPHFIFFLFLFYIWLCT